MNSFSRSLLLVKESFAVLKKDKELLLFPICSGILELVVIASFWIPLGYLYFGHKITISEGNSDTLNIIFYIILFLFYFTTYFVVTFFNAGLVSCAYKRLTGGDPTFKEGINAASQHVGKIFVWALISSTVGMILRMIAERGLLGRIVASVINIAWNIITYLIVPILIFENIGVKDSIKESESLFKKTWGEQILGNFSMGLFFGLLIIITFIPITGIIIYLFQTTMNFQAGGLDTFPFVPVLIVIGCVVMYVVILSIVYSALEGIFTAALYIYAKTNTVPSAFTPEVIQKAFKNKKGDTVPLQG